MRIIFVLEAWLKYLNKAKCYTIPPKQQHSSHNSSAHALLLQREWNHSWTFTHSWTLKLWNTLTKKCVCVCACMMSCILLLFCVCVLQKSVCASVCACIMWCVYASCVVVCVRVCERVCAHACMRVSYKKVCVEAYIMSCGVCMCVRVYVCVRACLMSRLYLLDSVRICGTCAQ